MKFLQFFSSSNFDYHLIIKKLANEFEGKFVYLGEEKEKHKTLPIPIKKEKEITKIKMVMEVLKLYLAK